MHVFSFINEGVGCGRRNVEAILDYFSVCTCIWESRRNVKYVQLEYESEGGGSAVGDGVGLTVEMDMLGHQRLAPGTYPRTVNQSQTPI